MPKMDLLVFKKILKKKEKLFKNHKKGVEFKIPQPSIAVNKREEMEFICIIFFK